MLIVEGESLITIDGILRQSSLSQMIFYNIFIVIFTVTTLPSSLIPLSPFMLRLFSSSILLICLDINGWKYLQENQS